jgi:hypothetical protein
MLDFDNIDYWAPRLTAVLSPHVPNSIEQKLREATQEYEYIKDIQDRFIDLTDREAVIKAVVAWLRSTEIVGYHGSRLTDEEIHSVQETGLVPLEAETRHGRLIRALSPHSKWQEVKAKLNETILAHGRGNRAGHREGQVHLTLSRVSLIQGFNHYLIYGSEFDQNVAEALLGIEGKKLLATFGQPRMFRVVVPGDLALNAANRIFSVDDFLSNGEAPNIVREFLEAWVCRLVYPDFQSQTLKVDCGMVFHQTIPTPWITGFETLNDNRLI